MTAPDAPDRRPWRVVADAPATTGVLALVGLALGAGALVLGTYEPAAYPRVDPYLTPFFGPHELNASILLMAPPFDSGGQRRAHLAVVLLVAGLVLWTLRGRREPLVPERLLRWLAPLPLALAAALLWSSPGATAGAIAARGFALLLVLGLGFSRSRRPLHAVLGLAALGLLAVAVAPAPFWRLDLAPFAERIVSIEWHFAMVVGPADLLAAGARLFGDVTPVYGAWPAVLAGAAGRWRGPLTWGDDVRLLQGAQALYLLGAALLYWRHGRRRGAWLFAGLVLVVPWYHFSQPGLQNPNLTPWRLVAMPLALLAATGLARRGPLFTAVGAGAIAGTAVLANLESGLALLGGFLAFVALRFRLLERTAGLEARFRAGAAFAFGLVVSLLALCLAVRVLLGHWPDLGRLPEIVAVAAFVSRSGYSGMALPPDVYPLLMTAHAAVVLLGTARARSAGFRPAFRALVATTLLLFLAYYANRPHPASVAPMQLLYGFLLVDLLRGLAARVARRRLSPAGALGAAALLVVAAPPTFDRLVIAAGQVREGLGGLGRAATASGVRLPPEWEGQARDRAAFLRSLGTRSVYLTADSYLTSKLAGPPAPPFLDLAAESIGRAGYRRALERLFRASPERVYLDAPGTLAHDDSLFRPFYEEARRDLGRDYRRRGVRSGWEVWTRVGDDLRERPPPEDWDRSPRIVAVGGASVEGRGLRAAWPERLGIALRGRGIAASVLNAGMDGQTVAGHEALLGRGLTSLRPRVTLLQAGLHDAPLVAQALVDGRMDLATRERLDLPGRRPARVMEACRTSWLPVYRERLASLLAAYRSAGLHPVLVTQPALFGPGKDPSTGVDLATVVVHPAARINGALAREALEAYNDVARDSARAAGVPLIDLADGFPRDSRLFEDLVRLSDDGAEEAAGRLAAALGALLEEE